ncbi:hypothetical protein ACJX0J_026677, partial [Zea mays]
MLLAFIAAYLIEEQQQDKLAMNNSRKFFNLKTTRWQWRFFLHVVAINVGMYNRGIIVAEKIALLQGAHSVIVWKQVHYFAWGFYLGFVDTLKLDYQRMWKDLPANQHIYYILLIFLFSGWDSAILESHILIRMGK